MLAVVAEKPSVARDIARVLGADARGEGCLRGNGYVVTWAIGHLVGLAEPHEMRPEWKRWRRDALPMLPEEWPLVVSTATADQFGIVKRILNAPEVEAVVCATDAGREGELIFRYIYEAARLPEAGAAAVDLVAHRRAPSARASAQLRDGARLRRRSPTPRAGAAAPTGSWA